MSVNRTIFKTILSLGVYFLAQVMSIAQAASLDTILSEASETNNLEIAQYALTLGANPNHLGNRGGSPDTPLNLAVKGNNLEMVSLLLENGGRAGAEPFFYQNHNLTAFPLFFAADPKVNPEIFGLLVQKAALLPGSENLVTYVAGWLARQGREEQLQLLADKGGDLGYITEGGICVPMEAAAGGHYALAARLIEKYREQLRSSPRKQLQAKNLVEYAAGRPWEEEQIIPIVNALVDLGFGFSQKDQWGGFPNSQAANYGLINLARALGGITNEENLKIIKSWRQRPEQTMHRAVTKLTFPELRQLIDQLASSQVERKQLLAMTLVTYGDIGPGGVKDPRENIERLVALGVDINVLATSWSNTAAPVSIFINAIGSRADDEFLGWLVAHGADVNRQVSVDDKHSYSALDIAISRNPGAIRFLLDHGVKVEDRGRGYSALVNTLKIHKTGAPASLIKMLLDAGADPYFKGGDSLSAVDIAAQRKDLMLLRQLDAKGQEKQLLAAYAHAKNSPLLGVWSNGQGEFKTVTISLAEDGLAILSGAVFGVSGLWRETSALEGVVELREKGQTGEMTVRLDERDGFLHLSGKTDGGMETILGRTESRPPGFAEFVPKEKSVEEVKKWQADYDQRKMDEQQKKELARATLLVELKQAVKATKPEQLSIVLRDLSVDNKRFGQHTSVNLRENWLDDLPVWFGELKNLTYLTLDENVFSSVPEPLRKLKKIEVLYLNDNQISRLPEWFAEIGDGKIKRLDLRGNEFTEVPPQIADLIELQELNLGDNRISAIPDFLAQMPKLKIISLGGNPIPVAERERFERLLGRKMYW